MNDRETLTGPATIKLSPQEHEERLAPKRSSGGTIEPLALPVAGAMRKGVFVDEDKNRCFIFIDGDGALNCFRLKISDNAIRATVQEFKISARVLEMLNGKSS